MKALRATVFISAALMACSGGASSGDGPNAGGDGGVDAAATTSASLDKGTPLGRARTLLALARPTDDLFAIGAEGLIRSDAVFVSPTYKAGTTADPSKMAARVPAALDEAIRVGPGKLQALATDVRLVGASPSTGTLDDGRVIYADAYPSTDVVIASRPRDLEIAYVLRDASAPSTLALQLTLGSGLSAAEKALPDGSLDFIDGSGDSALRVAPSFAIDAKGTVRRVPMRFVDGELTLTLDPTGLEYPILVDPDLSIPVWQLRATNSPSTSYPSNGVAWSSGLQRIVSAGNGYNSFQWDGTAWSSLGALPGNPVIPWNTTSSFGAGVLHFGSTGIAYVLEGSTWVTRCSSNCGPGAVQGAKLAWVSGGALLSGGRISNGAAIDELTARSGDDVDECLNGVRFIKTYFVAPGTTATFTHKPVPSTTTCYDYGNTWTNQPSWFQWNAPRARIDHSFAGDGADTAVLFGGTIASSGNIFDRDVGDTWIYHPSTSKWEEVCGGSSACVDAPSARHGAPMTYDAVRKKFVLYGGSVRSLSASNVVSQYYDTWELDPSTKKWTRVCTSCFSGGESPSGWDNNLAYNPVTKRSVGWFAASNVRYTYEYYMRANACTLDSQCNSGACFQGICCDAKCGTCQTCLDSTAVGQCKNVPAGTADPLNRCGTGQACDGAGACRKANGAVCAAGTECGSGSCVDATCCTTSSCGTGLTCATPTGVCKKSNGGVCTSSTECASGSCTDGVCCNVANCGAGSRCDYAGANGTCRKNNGQTCIAGQCGSGNCVDGYCCNSACTSQCAACDVVPGTCTPVVGTPHGTRTACSGAGDCASRCNGTDASACKFPGATLSCGAASCTAGTAKSTGTCDGAGACNQGTTGCGAYQCGGTACKSSCTGATSATDCASGYYCKTNVCAPKETLGASCTIGGAAACASGNCVDGVCCSAASCTGGARCDVAGAAGKCSKPKGIACSGDTECATGFCIDSVCCDTRCGSQCAACDVSGTVGTCTPVSGAPHGSRSACSAAAPTECSAVCNGVDTSQCRFPTTSKACGANSCVNGTERHTSVCNGLGTCSDTETQCNGFACGTTACKTLCTANTDCVTGFYCKTGACVQIEGLGTTCTNASTCTSGFCTDGVCCASGSCGLGKSCSAGTGTQKGICTSLPGSTCSANAECATGHCVDGVCCDTACDGACEACNTGGNGGKCVPIVGLPQVGHPACSATSTDPQCGLRCDGSDGKVCKNALPTVSCGAATCTGGVEQQVSTCTGDGACKQASKGCGSYACGEKACLTGCSSNAECASGNYCKEGSCVAIEGLGVKCTDASQCKTGFCTDGVCCGVTSCGTGSSCAEGPGDQAGQCLKARGQTCAGAGECSTGRCVDGVCCDVACNGQCEACDVSGSEGTCTPVVGKPRNARTGCDALAENDCARQSCDGVVRDKCSGFANGTATQCGSDACTEDKRFQRKGTCDGKGSCLVSDPKNCTPFACDLASASGCKSSCAADADCANGFTCDNQTCVQGATCNEDRTASLDKSGAATTCTPYRCGTDGQCLKACGSSDDCAAGTVCDTTVKACIIASAVAVEEESACALHGSGTRAPRRTGGSAMFLLVAAAAARTLRRRAA